MAKLEQPSSIPCTNDNEQRVRGNSVMENSEHIPSPPLHPTSTNQTPIMPPSARPSTQCRNGTHFHITSTPDILKATPLTVQMTPDYDAHDLIRTVPKNLCLLKEGSMIDVSSTEAADSSKSSEYEISDEVHRLGRDPSPQQQASRTLFSLENHDMDDDDDNFADYEEENSDGHYSEFVVNASTSTSFDTPNMSISTRSPSIERVSSDGIPSPPLYQQQHQHRSFRRHSTTKLPYDSSDHFFGEEKISKSNRHSRKLRSRRSVHMEWSPALTISPKLGKQQRFVKRRPSSAKVSSCSFLEVNVVSDEENISRDKSNDVCFSTDSDDGEYEIEKQTERLSDSSRRQHRSSLRNSASKKKNHTWLSLSQRLSSTKNLLWLLFFIGLTSVTMIVTMNHHISRASDMEQNDHVSVLFRRRFSHGTKGFVLPPPKLALKVPTPPVVSPLISENNIRGVSTLATYMSAPAKSNVKVNLNTLAQLLPGDKEKTKKDTKIQDMPTEAGSNEDHTHNHHHHSHHDSHRHDSNTHEKHSPESHSKESRYGTVSKPHKQVDASNDHELDHHIHHHHHHSDVKSKPLRTYLPARPSIIGMSSIPRIILPEIWDDDEVEAKFDLVDTALYPPIMESNVKLEHPRIVFLDGKPYSPTKRLVRRYRSEVTDSTQLYSILDSGDERIVSMERRAPYVQGECVPMKEWQTTFNPSCNGMHELDLSSMGDDHSEDDLKLFGMNGFWRNAWRYDSIAGHNVLSERDTVVLKTLRINHRFEDAYFENNRIDAVVLERLTASPHVINVFGFCGHSVLTEFADGKRLGELADKMSKIPLARLQIARDIANGLADVHGIDGDGNATFVHLDINPANVVSIGGTLKLNDFNIGVLRRWNTTSNSPCGIPAKYPNPQWRSPEEARLEQNLTEKVDVFSLGHIFFRLICEHEPWHKLEPGGMPSKEALSEKVRQGVLPTIPDEILTSTDPEISAIRDAMLRCYTYDPTDRPSAREIATYLQKSLDKLAAQNYQVNVE